MHAISQCPTTHFSNEAERLVGKLISRLKYSHAKDLEGDGATEIIEHIEDELARIAIAFNQSYMFSEIVDPAADNASETEAATSSQSQS